MENTATISGGKFTGRVKNGLSGFPYATITGGDFTEATVVDKGGSVTGGVFNGFTMDSTTHTLTITGDIDLSTGSLAPLTIALDDISIQSITVAENATFNAGDTPVSASVECNGTISGGTFTGAITGGGAIAGGDFSEANLSGFTGTATSGTFAKFELSCDEEGNVTLTTTGSIDLTSDNDDIAPITLADVDALVISDRTTFFGGDTVVTCPVTLYGTIEGGDFRQAEVTVGESATIRAGKFAILECDVNGAVTVTGAIDLDNMEENEARLWNAISAGMGELFIAGQASFDAGDDPLSVSAIRNFGKLTGGTFENNTIENHGEITGGTFNESVGNFSSITGGTFNGTVTNLETGSVIHGGTFLYRITGIGAIAGGDFTRADVTDVHGAITGGTFEGGLELENGRLHITEKTDWSSGVPGILGKLTYDELVVDASMSFNAGNATLPAKVTLLTGSTIHGGDFSNSALSMEPNVNFTAGKFQGFEYKDHTMTVTGEVDWSQGDGGLWEALYDVRAVVINADASFDAGENTISAAITNNDTIAGGTIDGEIRANTGTIKGCTFGPNATVTSNEGIIEVKAIVDEVEKTVNYGADVLEALGPSPTGLWYRVNADGTRSLVGEGEAFASLQGETYTSSPLLPKPEIEIDYINETFSVTLTEEEVPEGLDVTDLDIDFALEGQDPIFTGIYGLSCSWFLNQVGASWGIDLPSFKDTTLEVYYTFRVTNDDGEVIGTVYGERAEWVIPARPDINVDTVYPGYNEMTVTLDTEPYEVYLESVDGSTVIYDADDGAVDGCIHGLTEGTEYTVYFRVLPTEDSFASPQYYLVETFTTLTRTRLSVEAAETSWEWQQGFSLNAADCFAVQVTLQGEMDVPEKGKFILTATKDGQEVPFPLTEPGTYTITASLSADVADDYVLDSASFTVSIVQNQHPMNSRDITVRPIPAQTYTGGPIYPAVSVWHGATQLVMGEDYTVSYQNNVKVGVATIVITGMGDYAGTRLAFFDIVTSQATEEEEKPSGGSGTSGDNGETTETTGEAQQNRLVVDENGQAMPYTYSTVEVLDEETGALLARKLAIVAGPVRDETGAIVYDADGQPLYEARSLLLSRELLDAIAERGYTHIRFMVKGAALEWPLASMPEDNYIVRLAPLEEEEWNEREIAAIEGMPVLSQGYRAQIVTVMDGEETDVTKDVLELKALLLAEAVSFAPEGMEENLLLVPLKETVESSLSPANWVEATEIEPARFEALLTDSGLFAMVGE